MRSGSLTQGVLPRLLRGFYVGRKSGTLDLAREAERHTLRFSRGQLVGAEGNIETVSLGKLLAERELATRDELRQAQETAQRETRPLARVLAEIGKIERARLDETRTAHLRAVVQRLQTWPSGTYAVDESDGLVSEDLIAGFPMGDLILESTQAITDSEIARFALGDLDRVLAPSPDPLLRFQNIKLTPTDGYLLSRIDGTLSAREVSQLVPASADETALSLYGLYCAGLVEFLETTSKNVRSGMPPQRGAEATRAQPKPRASDSGPQPAAQPPAPPPQPQAAPRTASATVPPASPPGPPAAAAPPPPNKAESAEKRRREVLDLYRELGTKNHFEVLDLTRGANEVQVKEAYFALARRFHPDVFRGPSFVDVADQVAAVFIRLGEAYEVLKDPTRRGNYEARLPRTPPAATPAGPPSVVEGAASGPDAEVEARLAQEALGKAEKFLAQEQYWDAIQQVEPNLEKLKGKLKARGRMVLARCYLKNPNWSRRAEEQLKRVVAEEPKYAEAHYQLGSIYLAGGLKTRALSEFRKTVELNPLHEEAKAKVLELEPPPEEPPPPSGGLLGRLFGKGT